MPIEQDYILRLISMAGAMIREAMKKARAGQGAEALELLDTAVEHMARTSPLLLARLTPDGLVTFLGAGGPIDPLLAGTLADALDAKAETLGGLGRTKESGLHRAQAVALRESSSEPDGGSAELE